MTGTYSNMRKKSETSCKAPTRTPLLHAIRIMARIALLPLYDVSSFFCPVVSLGCRSDRKTVAYVRIAEFIEKSGREQDIGGLGKSAWVRSALI
jgi:hypothetical protein